MLFKKVGNGKYLKRIDSVEYWRESDFEGEYWPFVSDEVAYYHDNTGWWTANLDMIVEAEETEVERVFGDNWYKWKEKRK